MLHQLVSGTGRASDGRQFDDDRRQKLLLTVKCLHLERKGPSLTVNRISCDLSCSFVLHQGFMVL